MKIKRINDFINERLLLKNWNEYAKLVSDAYDKAPQFDENVVNHWKILNESNYKLFKRLLSKTKIIFVTQNKDLEGLKIDILNIDFIVKFYDKEPYDTQSEMKESYYKTKSLMISIDNSEHPIFSINDNIVFRCVHDFIVHILADHPFGLKGEIASYNTHAKLVPPQALPALFTEIVGQACYTIVNGKFPIQKIAILDGFDFNDIGNIKSYNIENKTLRKI